MTNSPSEIKHIDTCAILEKQPCPSNTSLYGEKVTEHWWSGWPGAFCLKCGAEDKDEICIGGGCPCPCHEDFWNQFQQHEELQSKLAAEDRRKEDSSPEDF